jgi:2-oxoacid:acceptor oxidoreductase delta subunit (pyruvate/2-ketoisovalerate family)
MERLKMENELGIKGLVLRGRGKQGGMLVGDWRIYTPKIDIDKCTRCWLCATYCPEDAVQKDEEGPKIDLRFCKGCGVCANECPSQAIDMVRE